MTGDIGDVGDVLQCFAISEITNTIFVTSAKWFFGVQTPILTFFFFFFAVGNDFLIKFAANF